MSCAFQDSFTVVVIMEEAVEVIATASEHTLELARTRSFVNRSKLCMRMTRVIRWLGATHVD